ncbi:TPA: hypothetical protein ACIPUI_001476 [Citrobacter freundii]
MSSLQVAFIKASWHRDIVSQATHHFLPMVEHISFYTDRFVKKGQEAARAVVPIHSLAFLED